MLIFTTQSSSHLISALAKIKGVKIGQLERYHFSDGELYVRILGNVKGKKVLIIGGTEAPTENLLELLFLTQAILENGGKPKVFIPYFGYARADKIDNPGEGHRLKLICRLLNNLCVEFRILEPHSPTIFKYLKKSKPLSVMPLLAKVVKKFLSPKNETIVVAPDYGARSRASLFAKHFGIKNILVVKKKRFLSRVKFAKLDIDFKDKTVVLVDDILDTGSTLFGAAKILHNLGAREIYAAVAHGVFSGRASEDLEKSKIKKLFVTNSLFKKLKSAKIIKIDVFKIFFDSLRHQ